MTDDDLDAMADLLGDPKVMAYYPAPKTRDEAATWIAWSQRNYAEHGYGLWIVETHEGQFVGDCGLTWQTANGTTKLEVGYHVRRELHGHGYATEAAAACRDLAQRVLGAEELVAIIHPLNAASRRVAEKIGMTHLTDDTSGHAAVRVMGTQFAATAPGRAGSSCPLLTFPIGGECEVTVEGKTATVRITRP